MVFWLSILILIGYLSSVISVFVVTLGLFPAVAAFVRPSGYDCHSEYHTKWFVPIWCFTLFNVTDTIGRMMSGMVDFPKPGEVNIVLRESSRVSKIFLVEETIIPLLGKNRFNGAIPNVQYQSRNGLS